MALVVNSREGWGSGEAEKEPLVGGSGLRGNNESEDYPLASGRRVYLT